MAELQHTVLAGGVIYAAGTPETDELRDLIEARHWTDAPGNPDASRTVTLTVDATAIAAELDQLRTIAAQEIESRDTRIADLEKAAQEAEEKLAAANAEVERLTSEVEQLTAAPPSTPSRRKPGPAAQGN